MFKKSILLFLTILMVSISLKAQHVIQGNVFDSHDGETLIGAHVSLQPANLHSITDAKGRFVFDNVKAGRYVLTATYVGFETKDDTIEVSNDVTVDIRLNAKSYMQDEVVVLSTRIADKTPLTYTDVNAAEIRKDNMGADLPFLLQNTPSLVVTSDAGTGIGYTSLRIRGSDLTRINVTLNGVPVNGAEDHNVYFVDLPDLASSVDNIQIQRGVGTSANGAAAFGASLNIKTDESQTDPMATLSSSAGSFNTLKNTLTFSSGRNKQGFALNGRVSKITSDGYVDRGWSDLGSVYLSGIWSNKNNMLKAIFMSGTETTYQAWNGIPKAMLETNPTYNPAGEIFDNDGNLLGFYDNETDNYTQNHYQLHYAHSFNSNTTLTSSAFVTTGNGYYENYKNDKKLSNYGLSPIVTGDTVIKRTSLVQQKWLDNIFYGFNAALNYRQGRFNTNFGGGWSSFDGDHYGIIKWAACGLPLEYEWYRNNGRKTDCNIFAKSTVDITERFNIFADVQYRHINYALDGINDDLLDLTQTHIFDFLNPKGGVFFKINNSNSMYFSTAFSHREPNRSIYTDADESQIGSIKAEKLLDYELGHVFNGKALNVSTNIFFMDYTDQLVMTGEINDVGKACMTNVDDSYRLGIESSIDYRIGNRLELTGNISLSRNKILNFTDYIEDWDNGGNHITNLGTTDISFSPNVVGGLALNYKPISCLNLCLQGHYVGRQYIDNTSNIDRSLDPYFVSNFNMSFDWQQKLFRTLNVNLSVNNIFNTKYCTYAWVYRAWTEGAEYLEDGYFPQAGTNLMLGITIGI